MWAMKHFLDRTVNLKKLDESYVLVEYDPNDVQVGPNYYNMQHEDYGFEVSTFSAHRSIEQFKEHKNSKSEREESFSVEREYITAQLQPIGRTKVYSMFGTERVVKEISLTCYPTENEEYCKVGGWDKFSDFHGEEFLTHEDKIYFSVYLNKNKFERIIASCIQNIKPKISFSVGGVEGFYGGSELIESGLSQYVGSSTPPSIKVLCGDNHFERIGMERTNEKEFNLSMLGKTRDFRLSLSFESDLLEKTEEEEKNSTKIKELSEQLLTLEEKNKYLSAELEIIQDELKKTKSESVKVKQSDVENRRETKSFQDMIANNYPLIFKIGLGLTFVVLLSSLIKFFEIQSYFTFSNIVSFFMTIIFSIMLAALPISLLVFLYQFLFSSEKNTHEIWQDNKFFLWTLVTMVWIGGLIYFWDNIQHSFL